MSNIYQTTTWVICRRNILISRTVTELTKSWQIRCCKSTSHGIRRPTADAEVRHIQSVKKSCSKFDIAFLVNDKFLRYAHVKFKETRSINNQVVKTTLAGKPLQTVAESRRSNKSALRTARSECRSITVVGGVGRVYVKCLLRIQDDVVRQVIARLGNR